MIALINTMNSIQSDSIGTVISLHRSVAQAEAKSGRFAAAVRKANGQNSFIPTRIVRLKKRHVVGEHVNPQWAEAVEIA